MFFGSQFFHLDKVDSTNNFAANLIEKGLCQNGAVILADEQTLGRGQRDSLWESESHKNILCSFVYFPDNVSVDKLEAYNYCLSIALVNCLKLFQIDAAIKWPNDILVNNKKIAGVLIENSLSAGKIKSMIFGVGLNVNQLNFNYSHATSMAVIADKVFDLSEVSSCLTQQFNHWISFVGNKTPLLKQQYTSNLFGLQKVLRFKTLLHELDGVIVGVNENGELEVNIEGNVRSFKNKEISFLL
jgi:BirA family biotin operon repressor/biotin-[acetyl-CoA-carboxylase] ligase